MFIPVPQNSEDWVGEGHGTNTTYQSTLSVNFHTDLIPLLKFKT